MRLLNASTLEMREFSGNNIPPYAILSHTWGEDEVLLEHMRDKTFMNRAGYRKIHFTRSQAFRDGIEYIWVDTCCIDKVSSAELTEAINSMYSWYKHAQVCYAFLSDVTADMQGQFVEEEFAASRWFKRGWTLQELIAPARVHFFSSEEVMIGSKSSLQEVISRVTGVDRDILNGSKDLQTTSIAKRMSWSAQRQTTRLEDTAYCLMGIFDVNMPMLYGEGEKAFIRLQEEIMKNSDDQSLFAWTDPSAEADSLHGLLATSPAYFSIGSQVVSYSDWSARPPFTMTNKGLRIDLPLKRIGKGSSKEEGHTRGRKDSQQFRDDLFIAALDCPVPPRFEKFLGIFLQRLPTGSNQFVRIRPQVLTEVPSPGTIETIYVRQNPTLKGIQDVYPQHIFQLRTGPCDGDYDLREIAPSSTDAVPPVHAGRKRNWGTRVLTSTFEINKSPGKVSVALTFRRTDKQAVTVLLGSTQNFGIGFCAIPMPPTKLVLSADLDTLFQPHQMGSLVSLEYHQVMVHAEMMVQSGVKFYLIDIEIYPRNKQATAAAGTTATYTNGLSKSGSVVTSPTTSTMTLSPTTTTMTSPNPLDFVLSRIQSDETTMTSSSISSQDGGKDADAISNSRFSWISKKPFKKSSTN